jgi:hypothetical protein
MEVIFMVDEARVRVVKQTISKVAQDEGITPEQVVEDDKEDDGPINKNFEEEVIEEALGELGDR